MIVRFLFHGCWVAVSFVSALIAAMALYTYVGASVMRSFLMVFGGLEVLHLILIQRKQFVHQQRATLLNNLHFAMLGILSGFVVVFYANLDSWRLDGDTTAEFRTFTYFLDNIFLFNLVIFIANFWFLSRNLLRRSFRNS